MTPGPMMRNPFLGAILPTLFLGLGGTGKEVLLRLRRKFYERLGVTGLPCTAYLWLDTDTKDNKTADDKDDIYSVVAFNPDEKIALLSGSVKESLGRVLDDESHWPHVHKWLFPEVKQYGAEISDGAGGVRAIGRLTYFDRFAEDIDPGLRRAVDSVLFQERVTETKEFFRSKKMGAVEFPEKAAAQVFLICSLAGGTGCGTFLDAAFHLRYLAREAGVPIERIVAILFMPNIFFANRASEVARRSYGNAYAALKELEYYTLRVANAATDMSIDYRVEWQRGQQRRIQGPPFAIAYLQEMKNESNSPLDPKNRSELFNVVAESLFLDFMPGDFSTEKRSNYANVAQSLATKAGTNVSFQQVELPQVFARRYASFGMSKIEIPMDQVKAACAAYLGHQVAYT